MARVSWASLLLWPLGKLGALVRALFAWLGRDFRNVAITVLALAGALLWWTLGSTRSERDTARASATTWETSAKDWQAARDELANSTRQASLAAAQADKANAARVAAELDKVKERTANDYQDRLADSRAALERLRRDLAAAGAQTDPGGGGAAAVPPALGARCRAFGAADCDALLAALPDLLSAAEDNTAKLIALQDWARSMLAVDFSGSGAGTDTGNDAGEAPK